MAESVYKVIELVGTSTDSWEAAGRAAVERAGRNIARPAHCRGGRAGYSGQGRQGRAVSSQDEIIIQVRKGAGLTSQRIRSFCVGAASETLEDYLSR